MNDTLDIMWNSIMDGFTWVGSMLDALLAPLNASIGPALVIFTLVIALVALTKLLNRIYTTKRHIELKANYEHWYRLRKEAMTCEDRETGKALARNIDQAELNKAYYDYFFEGFLKSILTTILPVLFFAAYVNYAYAPESLHRQLGRNFIFEFSGSGGEPVRISAFFWFVICLVLVHLAWFAIRVVGSLLFNRKTDPPDSPIEKA